MIFERAGLFYGRILWRAVEGRDVDNQDPGLRSRNLVGIEFIQGFAFDGEDDSVGGTLHAPDSGSTFKGRMWLEGEVLEMRGYVGVPLFGRTMSCRRLAAPTS